MRSRWTIFFIFATICCQSQADFQGLKRLNDTDLYLTIKGKGEYLLVIHGGPGLNQSYFHPHLDILSKHYTLVYFDQRASGRSSIPSSDSISLKFFTEDIDAIRRMLKVGKLNILAHSWGSIPATRYALTYPDRVEKLVYSNPVPLNKEYDAEMAEFSRSHIGKSDSTLRAKIMASRDFSVSNMTELMKISFRASAYDKTNIDKLDLELPPNVTQANQALYTGLGKDLSVYDWYDDVEKFSFPVLIIQGEHDGIPEKSITRLKDAIPRSSAVLFTKSGHFPFLEEPTKFENVIVAFLK